MMGVWGGANGLTDQLARLGECSLSVSVLKALFLQFHVLLVCSEIAHFIFEEPYMSSGLGSLIWTFSEMDFVTKIF